MPESTKNSVVFASKKAVKGETFKKAKFYFANNLPSQKKVLTYAYEKKRILSSYRSIISDQSRRSAFEKRELENQVLKSALRMNSQTNFGFERLLLSPKIRSRHTPGGSLTRVRNRCVLSAHRSCVGNLGLSRIKLRQLAGLGCLPGLIKI